MRFARTVPTNSDCIAEFTIDSMELPRSFGFDDNDAGPKLLRMQLRQLPGLKRFTTATRRLSQSRAIALEASNWPNGRGRIKFSITANPDIRKKFCKRRAIAV